MREFAGAATSRGICAILTGELAQFSFVYVWNYTTREEALGEIPLQTNRAGTLAVDAKLEN